MIELGTEVAVMDVMSGPSPVVPAHISMGAARKIARLKSADLLLVEQQEQLIGMIDGYTLESAADDDAVSDCMKPALLSLHPSTSVRRARELLIKHGVPTLPVAAGPFLVGTLSRATVERALAGARRYAPPLSRAA